MVRHPLQPYGLPDAALRRIEHAPGLQGLLAPCLSALPGGVLHRHPQAVAVGAVEQIGDIQIKTPVAAPVLSGKVSVYLYGTGIVHRPKMQQHPSPFSRRRGKGAVVVEPLPRAQGAPHPRRRRFRGVGHQNAAIPRRRVLRRRGNGILPQTIQVLITVTAHRRAGIFRKRMHNAHRLSFFFILAQTAAFVYRPTKKPLHQTVQQLLPLIQITDRRITRPLRPRRPPQTWACRTRC